jgi:RecA/RadA recombinase
MARAKKEKPVTNSFDFFADLKTGNKEADSKKGTKETTWIDTGCYSYNGLISGDLSKGFPTNRVFMLAGEEAVGKTFFGIFGFCKPLVDQGYFIYYIDTENAVDNHLLEGFGLPAGSFKILREDVVEETRTRVDAILTKLEDAKGRKSVNENKCAFVLDSQGMLDSLKSRTDTANEHYVNDMTLQKELKKFYKTVVKRLGDLDIPMLVTNHVYANIGGYGSATKVAGGSGGLYASSVILHLRKKQYKEGTIKVGTIVTAKNVKSRLCQDGLEGAMYLNYERGLNKWYGLHTLALDAKLIEKWSATKFDKKGVIGPEKAGNSNFYVIKDPKLAMDKWIVCKENDLHKKSTIGTIFDEINDHVKETFKLKRPVDFSWDDVEDEITVDIDEDNLVDADTKASKAAKKAKASGLTVELDE